MQKRSVRACFAAALILVAAGARAQQEPQRRLPFLAEEARKRGYELPLTYGVGLVYYKLQRDIKVNAVRVGRNGADPVTVPDFVHFGSNSDVDNLNLKADVWLLPFLNIYAIVGTIKNESATSIALTLPPRVPGGQGREFQTVVPTELSGTVGGLGTTLAGGVGSFFGALDVNIAKADLGFDDRFRALVASARAGWHGKTGNARPIRFWANATYWDTAAIAKGTVADPDGGTISFEVDQGPSEPMTYGVGMSYSPSRHWELSFDTGSDFKGGWYVALVPVFRF